MRRHLTDSHDKAMTEHFADGTAHPGQPRAALPAVEPFIGKFRSNVRQRPGTANSARCESGDIGPPNKQAVPQDDGVSYVYDLTRRGERRADNHMNRHARACGIQYAACRFDHCCLWNTGSPGPVCAKASTGHAIFLARRSFSEGGKPGDDE
jgi:hypothetical protein